jgi:hypothetical protein
MVGDGSFWENPFSSCEFVTSHNPIRMSAPRNEIRSQCSQEHFCIEGGSIGLVCQGAPAKHPV